MTKTIKHLSVAIALLAYALVSYAQTKGADREERVKVIASGFKPGANMQAPGDSGQTLSFFIEPRAAVPFTQSAIIQDNRLSTYGPAADVPFFRVEFSLPIPPAYTQEDVAELTGMDIGLGNHNHSPGLEVMPNGDLLAVYFSTPAGKAEKDTATTFVQARLRFGSKEWDLPELFFKTEGYNDQSALLWNDNGKIWFFGGGRSISDYVPFRIATSSDNGASWTFSIPQLDKRGEDFTAQPINSAFRSPDGNIYFAMDAHGGKSLLWRSNDNGSHWHDMGGRTGARHSTIVPLNGSGTLLSIGGKNANIDGWNPQNISHDWGATWTESTESPFPPLGGGQRPSMIRLSSGNLLYVSDAYLLRSTIALPEKWKHGKNAFVAISKDNGATWRVKTLPEGLPQKNPEDFTSVGYTVARQSPNGIIHVITTRNLPALHYEFNEAWIWKDDTPMDEQPSAKSSKRHFTERFPNGNLKSKWSAIICSNGEYLLNGAQTDYYENGNKQHHVVYSMGRKTGKEVFWNEDGTVRWQWKRNIKTNRGVWTHFWPNGKKRIESHWQLLFKPRDGDKEYVGYRADGKACHFNEDGKLKAEYAFVNGDIMPEEKTETMK